MTMDRLWKLGICWDDSVMRWRIDEQVLLQQIRMECSERHQWIVVEMGMAVQGVVEVECCEGFDEVLRDAL